MRTLMLFLLLAAAGQVSAQVSTDSLPGLDKSPMDESYFPANYPILKVEGKISGTPVMRVIYSRPQMKGRKIFGDLIPFGQVWRLGANEATEIEFFTEVRIDQKKVPKGRYTVYAIPYPDTWTLILNRDTDTWGSFHYDSSRDVLRTDIPVVHFGPTEALTIVFHARGGGATMDIYWDDANVSLPITF